MIKKQRYHLTKKAKGMVFPSVMYRCDSWPLRRLSTRKLMLSNCGATEDFWEYPGQQGDWTSQSWRKSTLNIHWKDWLGSWSSSPLTTWCEELTHLKRPWCWESLKAGGEGDDRGWDGWMVSLTQWTWVWVNFMSSWWTGRPGVLESMGLQRVGQDWATELNWMEIGRAHVWTPVT